MKERFIQCVTQLLSDKARPEMQLYINHYYDTLVEAYTEDRYYHTLNHIEYMLVNLDKYFSNLLIPLDKLKVELGIWFHDIIYDTSYDPGINELLSSMQFQLFGETLLMDEKVINEISVLIKFTTHTKIPETLLQKIICDLDLLGLYGLDYWTNREKVLTEYTQEFSDEEFLEGRLSFLDWMIAKKHIFHTGLFQKHFEESARNNLNLEKKYFYV